MTGFYTEPGKASWRAQERAGDPAEGNNLEVVPVVEGMMEILRVYEGAELIWVGDLSDLVEANGDLTEFEVHQLMGLEPGASLLMGNGFRVERVEESVVPRIDVTRGAK